MIEIQNNKILLDGKKLQFDNKIIEAAEHEGKVVIVFETDEDGGYDNVFCYTLDLQLLWNCRAIDFYGRRFRVNLENGEIISKDIVR